MKRLISTVTVCLLIFTSSIGQFARQNQDSIPVVIQLVPTGPHSYSLQKDTFKGY